MKRWTQHSEQDERIASLHAIPRDCLPDGPARDALLALASNGVECYAYQPVMCDWRIWLQPAQPSWEARMSCEAWLLVYELASQWSRPAEPVTPDSERLALERAVVSATTQLALGWAQANRETPGRRPMRATRLEQVLSYLRWRLIMAYGADEGQRRFTLCWGHVWRQFSSDGNRNGGQTI